MTDKTIDDLSTAGTLTGTEEIPIFQGGNTVKVAASLIAALASGSFHDSDYALSGYSLRYNAVIATVGLMDTLDYIFNFGYSPSSISLAQSGAPTGTFEKGDTRYTSVSLTLNATTSVTTPGVTITDVKFRRNGTTIQDVIAPTHPNGGLETYVSTQSIVGTTNPTTDTITFDATETDSHPNTQGSNSLTYKFVYPYYYGVGPQGLSNGCALWATATAYNLNTWVSYQGTVYYCIQGHTSGAITPTNASYWTALNKTIGAVSASFSFTSSPNSQVFYYVYPAYNGALSSIKDPNGFETINDYIGASAGVNINITGLDGSAQSYKVYELSHVTTQTNFKNTYIQ